MKRKYIVMLAMLLALTMLFAACSQPATTEAPATEAGATEAGATEAGTTEAGTTEAAAPAGDNPAKARAGADNTIVVGVAETTGVFNPIYYSTAYDGYVVELVFDGLISNDEAGEYIPHLAESWTISEDGKQITFKLREDVKFSDGEPLTAEDVVFTYRAMADPSYEGRYSYIPQKLAGYEEYKNSITPEVTEAETEEGATEAETEAAAETEAPAATGEAVEYAGVVANGDYEVTFNFTEANATNLGDTGMAILPAHVYEYEPGKLSQMTAKHGNPIGSGPYTFANFAAGEYIEFKANPNYFLGAPKIENMILRFTAKETEMSAFQNGEFDVIESVPNTPENEEVAAGMASFAELVRYDNNGYAYIGINMDNPSLAKKEVRQALAYGFDRYAFVEDFFQGSAVVPNVPFARVSWVFSDELEADLNKYEYDPDKAIELLESVGYMDDGSGVRTDGTNKLSFAFETYADTEWTEVLVAILKAEWGQIGVEINENFQEFAGFSQKIYAERDFDLYTMAWSLSLDPSPRQIFHSENIYEGGNNSVGWNNPENDRLLVEGELEMDQAKRAEIYTEWGKLWNDELPYIPVYMRENWQLVNTRVSGWETSPFMTWRNPAVLLNLELVD